jgi:hypothetical protein
MRQIHKTLLKEINKECVKCHFNMIDPNPPYVYCWFIKHYLDTENQSLFRENKAEKCYYFKTLKKIKELKNYSRDTKFI